MFLKSIMAAGGALLLAATAPAQITPPVETPTEAAPADPVQPPEQAPPAPIPPADPTTPETTPADPAPEPTAAEPDEAAAAAAAAAQKARIALAMTTPPLDPENTLNLDLSTGGRVVVQLRPDLAPNHVERIKALARQGFYNGVIFHRVIDGFMAQTGDPTGTGQGGSPLPDLVAEFNPLPHVRGAVSAARTAEPNTANSQFFIMLGPRLTLDNRYSTFGRVVSGMQYVDAIERGEPPANPSRIVRASIGADGVPPLPASALMAPPAPAPVEAPAPAMVPTEQPAQ